MKRLYHRIPPNHTLHSTREVADHLGICQRTVWRYVEKYGLPLVMGRDGIYFTTVGALDRWVESYQMMRH